VSHQQVLISCQVNSEFWQTLDASHAIDNGAPITLHADLTTTSVYADARPGESSGRYLKGKFTNLWLGFAQG
jgi:hypothetical protein